MLLEMLSLSCVRRQKGSNTDFVCVCVCETITIGLLQKVINGPGGFWKCTVHANMFNALW